GTAMAGGDYTAISGTLTFTPGVTSQTFAITIADDGLDEYDETITLTLSNADNATIGGVNSATLTILDDDPSPSLSINDVSVVEGNSGSVNTVFSVTLSAASSKPITVEYGTADGSATAPTDYTAIPTTTLTFAPGVTTQLLTVSVQGDTLDEPDETFWINLANAVNASIGDAQGQGTIIDDDGQPSVRFSRADYVIGEVAGSANITITLSNSYFLTATVDYATGGGTATAGGDYTAISGTLTFTPGVTSQTFAVAIADDGMDE
ncbi:unnamed protein product, partial [marine sediment metagenome]